MRVAIGGASTSGLAVAIALARAGHDVQIFERDPAAPAGTGAGVNGWRRGTPQARHSHAFLARLRLLLRDREPELLDELAASGVTELSFERIAAMMIEAPELEPADDEVALLACRRATFEAALRRHALAQPGVTLRTGTSIRGLELDELAGSQQAIPRVIGFAIRNERGDDEVALAELCVDATGRGSRIDLWLEAAGIEPLRREHEACGIFYASRFYRMHGCSDTPTFPGGVMAADLGYLKAGLFPGDSGTFSLTLAASPDDVPLRALLRERGFEIAARALPSVAPFVDPQRAEPISRVHGMGGLEGSRRFPLREDGEPALLGLALVGDAQIHTNPLYGRGCTLGFVHAYAIADALADEPEVGRAFALELERRVERELVPWYESSRAQDCDAREVAAQLAAGRDPYASNREDGSVDPRGYMRSLMRDGLGPALREDVALLRAFLRVFNLLEAPQDLMRDPSILQRVLASYTRRAAREPIAVGPDRATMVEMLQ